MKIEPIRLGDDLAKIVAAAVLLQAFGLFKAALKGVDLLPFWAAGRLAIQGRGAEAYNFDLLRQVEATSGASLAFPFLNPPPFLMLFAPISALSYPLALVVWGLLTYGVYLSAARRLRPRTTFLVAVFPPALLNLILGQNGLLIGGLFIWSMLLLERRSIVAGVLIGLMTIKPQLGVLVPIALLAAGHYRTFAAAAVTTVLLFGAAELLMPGSTAAFLANARFSSSLIERPEILGKLHSLYGALRLAGAPAWAAGSAQGLAALAATAAVWRCWRGERPILAKAAVLAAATPLATPYVFDYDLTLLIVPLALIAPRRPALAAATFLAPAGTRILALVSGVALGPALSAALLIASLIELRPSERTAQPAAV